ncbi:MAG: hypothetical protein ACD_22C00166G0017, partial [uncultured bacterium]
MPDRAEARKAGSTVEPVREAN